MARYSFILLLVILLSSCHSSNNVTIDHKLISDTIQIKKDMDSIVLTGEYRNYKNLKSLNKVADYIKSEFQSISDSVKEQNYNYRETQYKNIICSINVSVR